MNTSKIIDTLETYQSLRTINLVWPTRLVFGGYKALQRRNSLSRLFSGGLGIYRRGWRREQVRGPHGESMRHRGAPSTLVGPTGLPSSNSSFQYFLYFPEKLSVDFHRIPRTFISAQKQHHDSSAENSVSTG